ncbi:MAG TPA: NUDIX hydrolase [Salinivirgaceae bacterium]|nr:NUDIX hydrolase [Salinivirgaceae bacterium]HQA76536.1 NUDIX hydrolase [Salinivirgaceae bacterium]
MSFIYQYPRPAVTADIVLIDKNDSELHVLLIQRKNPPYQDQWAFPGGFMEMDETLIETAQRELFEETGVKNVELTQFKTYDAIDRDPRHRTISTVFIGYCNKNSLVSAGDDALNAKWFSINKIPRLAFDHALILKDILSYISQS